MNAAAMTSPTVNPYESPRSELSDEVPELYAIDNRRLSAGETWRVLRNPLVFVFAMFYKLLGIRSRPVFAFGPGLRLIDWGELPENIRASTDERLQQALAAGFLGQFTYYSPSVGCGASLGHALLSSDGSLAMVISQARTWVGQTVHEELATALFSRLSETDYLVTTTAPYRLETPERTTEYHPRFSFAQLRERHEQRLAESGRTPLIWRSGAELEESIRAREQRIIEHYKQRQLCVPVSSAEYRDLLLVTRNGGPVAVPKPVAMQALEWLFCVMFATGLILLWQPRLPGSWLGVLGWCLIAVGILSLIAVNVKYPRRR
jgi:hypothetical protein